MPNFPKEELHYITPITNIPSIMQKGILCHNEAQKLPHVDISMNEVQERRANKKVPNGLYLHEYANPYFDARNPMLYLRRNQNSELCILRIKSDVLNLTGVVLSDKNASSGYARFYDSPNGLKYLNFEKIFAKYWTSIDYFVYMENKSTKCAEVLVSERVQPELIFGAYVCNRKAEELLTQSSFNLPININNSIFF